MALARVDRSPPKLDLPPTLSLYCLPIPFPVACLPLQSLLLLLLRALRLARYVNPDSVICWVACPPDYPS